MCVTQFTKQIMLPVIFIAIVNRSGRIRVFRSWQHLLWFIYVCRENLRLCSSIDAISI